MFLCMAGRRCEVRQLKFLLSSSFWFLSLFTLRTWCKETKDTPLVRSDSVVVWEGKESIVNLQSSDHMYGMPTWQFGEASQEVWGQAIEVPYILIILSQIDI